MNLNETPYQTRNELVKKIFRQVMAGHYVSLMGPEGRGKTTILQKLEQLIEQENKISNTHIPIMIDMLDMATAKMVTKSEYLQFVLDKIIAKSGKEPQLWKKVTDNILLEQLKKLTLQPARLVLMIDHIDVLPYDVARELLNTLRTLYDKAAGGKHTMGVIIAGTINLLYLTIGSLSPFNIAISYFIEPLRFMESSEFLDALTRENSFLTIENKDEIYRITNGEPYLMQKIVNHMAKGKFTVSEAFEKMIIFWQNDALLRSSVHDIEKNNSWLRLVADLCAGRNPEFTGAENNSPDMCLSLVKQRGKYMFASTFWERLLTSHFTEIRLADSFVLVGKWTEAKELYEKCNYPRGEFKIDSYTLDDLVISAFETLNPAIGITKIQNETVAIARYALGVDYACFMERTNQNKDNSQIRWIQCEGYQRCKVPKELCEEICGRAYDRQFRYEANDGMILVYPIQERRGESKWCFCINNSIYRFSEKQKKAINLLVKYCAISISEAKEINDRDLLLAKQKGQLKISEIGIKIGIEAIQRGLDLNKTVKVILEQLTKFNFPHAMISILDKNQSRVIAINASGCMESLKETYHDINSGDILSFIIQSANKYKQGVYIGDCYNDDRCDQANVRLIKLRSQLIIPLIAPGIGLPKNNAFGALQIGNIPEPHPRSYEESSLQMIVRSASIALANALLYEEVKDYVKNQDMQLGTMMDISGIIASSEGIDTILDKMFQIIFSRFEAENGGILLKDPDLDKLIIRAWKGRGLDKFEFDIDDQSTIGGVYVTGKSINNSDVSKAEYYSEGFAGVQSNCAVPIPIEGKLEGVLIIESTRLNAFSGEHLKLLETIGHIIGSMIIKARAMVKSRTLSRILSTMAENVPIEDRLYHATVIIAEELGAAGCSIFVQPEGVEDQIVLEATNSEHLINNINRASYGMGEGLTGWIAQKQKALRLVGKFSQIGKLISATPSLEYFDSKLEWKSKFNEFDENTPLDKVSFLGAPLVAASGDNCLGTVRCVTKQGFLQFFTHDDQEILKLIGNQIALVIKQIRLTHETARREAEIKYAQRINHHVKNSVANIRGLCSRLNRVVKNDTFVSKEFLYISERLSKIANRFEEVRNDFLRIIEQEKNGTLTKEAEREVSSTMIMEKTIIDLDEVIEEVLTNSQDTFPLLKIHPELNDKSLNVIGTRNEIYDTLFELIINANYWTQIKGDNNVTVSVKKVDSCEPFRARLPNCKSPLVKIDFINDGPIIPTNQLETIFNAGYSTRDSDGNGLSVAREAIKRCGGTIYATEPMNGIGAHFVILLCLSK
jgi:GAF domain-containing protein/energy-coupling factor transporter ATP-binding protein EcfA2